jgi:hypothetical protein
MEVRAKGRQSSASHIHSSVSSRHPSLGISSTSTALAVIPEQHALQNSGLPVSKEQQGAVLGLGGTVSSTEWRESPTLAVNPHLRSVSALPRSSEKGPPGGSGIETSVAGSCEVCTKRWSETMLSEKGTSPDTLRRPARDKYSTRKLAKKEEKIEKKMEKVRIQALIAGYLDAEGLPQSLAAFLSETGHTRDTLRLDTSHHLSNELQMLLDHHALAEVESPSSTPSFYSVPTATTPPVTEEVFASSSAHPNKNITCCRCVGAREGLVVTGAVDESVVLSEVMTGEVRGRAVVGGGAVISIDCHPTDPELVAAGSMGGSVAIIRGMVVVERAASHEKYVVGVRFTPDGTTLVSLGYDKRLVARDAEGAGGGYGKAREMTLLGVSENFSLHPSRPREVVFGVRGDHRLHYVNVDTMTAEHVSVNASAGDTHCSFNVMYTTLSPDGSFVLISTDENKIIMLPYRGSAHVRVFYGSLNDEYSFPRTVFDPNGQYIYATSQDDSIVVWDCEAQKVRGKLTGHTARVRDLDFQSSNRHLVSVGFDKAIRVWSVPEPK